MSRDDIEAALRRAYACRASNDARGCAAIFAPGATYKVAGHQAFCGAVTTYRDAEIQPAIEKLCGTFHAKDFTITSMIIEGHRASVLIDASFHFNPSGETVTTQLAHFWTFEDGKATDVVEFLDTAAVAHLLAA